MLTKDLISRVRKIEIRTRRMVENITAGAYHSIFKGSGIEFEDVREYTSDDDVRDIDWNVTAKMGTPYIKKYVEERELTVMLLVDISASGYFGQGDKTKKDTAIEIASLLAFSAIRNNDKAGLMLFTDKVELFLPPKSGRLHTLRLIRDLIGKQPEGKGTDIVMALERIMKILRKRAVIFLISDFIAEKDYRKTLTLVNKRHDVIAVRVLDKMELQCPKLGFLNIADSESGAVSHFHATGKNVENYLKNAEELHARHADICTKSKVDMIDIKCGEDLVKPLMKFFRQRERVLSKI